MFLTPGVVLQAVLFVVGCLWCRAVLGRCRQDLAEFRAATDPQTRATIGLLWFATGVIALMMAGFLHSLAVRLGLV